MSWPESFGFAIGGDSPVVIVAVVENSVAQKAGLQPGDQLLEIDDENVQSYSKEEVIACAERQTEFPPMISVVSRIRTIELMYNDNFGYGLLFKGLYKIFIQSMKR